MIGFEYICTIYNVNYVEIANMLDISKQTVNSWTSGRRNIPEKYVQTLSQKFNVPEEYFQKGLTEFDKMKILRSKLINERYSIKVIYKATKEQMINDMKNCKDVMVNSMDESEINAFFKDLDAMCKLGAVLGIEKQGDSYITTKKEIADGYKEEFGINFTQIRCKFNENGEMQELGENK